MVDMMMLLVALIAFATLIVGWMILPDAPAAHSSEATVAPSQAAKAA